MFSHGNGLQSPYNELLSYGTALNTALKKNAP